MGKKILICALQRLGPENEIVRQFLPLVISYCSCSAEGVSKAKEVVKPFDWTFTTNYMGTTSSRGGAPDWEVGETKLQYYIATVLICNFFGTDC